MSIQSSTDYTKKIINKLLKKGIVKKADDIVLKPNHWYVRKQNSILGIAKKTNEITYLAYFPMKSLGTKYFYNGNEIDKSEIDFIPSEFKNYGSSTQKDAGLELEEQIPIRCLKLENIRTLKINGDIINYNPS